MPAARGRHRSPSGGGRCRAGRLPAERLYHRAGAVAATAARRGRGQSARRTRRARGGL